MTATEPEPEARNLGIHTPLSSSDAGPLHALCEELGDSISKSRECLTASSLGIWSLQRDWGNSEKSCSQAGDSNSTL